MKQRRHDEVMSCLFHCVHRIGTFYLKLNIGRDSTILRNVERKFNRKMKKRIERIALCAGLIASVFSLYYFYHFDFFDGAAFFYALFLYPIGIFCFSLAPVDGVLGRWVIPLYGLLWSILNWYVFTKGWDSKNTTGEGLDAGMFILIFQTFGNILPFLFKKQRWIFSRLGITLMLFYPGSFLWLLIS